MYQNIILPSKARFFNTHRSNINIRKLFMVLLISLTVISCVTINIYFPAAAAEKAAEKIVDEVLHSDDAVPGDTEEKGNKVNDTQSLNLRNYPFHNTQLHTAQLHKKQRAAGETILLSMIEFLIPSAHAGEANISIDSPKIRSIRNSMENRQSKLRPFYQSGAAGFTHDGFIAAVKSSDLSVKQQSTLKKLISAENNDRQALYREIAIANGHPEWQADIQQTFAKTWINKISKGWMYQTPAGQWVKK